VLLATRTLKATRIGNIVKAKVLLPLSRPPSRWPFPAKRGDIYGPPRDLSKEKSLQNQFLSPPRWKQA
jgi:hypothetical protein